MSTTFTNPDAAVAPAPLAAADSSPRPVWRAGLAAGIAASLATTLVAVVAELAGASLEIGGEPIPPSGFATLTMVGAVIGIALAAVLARRADKARSTFVRTAVLLTVLSLVPDVIADADVATRVILGFTHVVGAAIIVPPIARRLAA
jgi:hypothetical protein